MQSDVLRGSLRDGSSLKGNEFTTAPRHSASLWSYYDVPGTDVSVGLGARYVGAYYLDAANTRKPMAPRCSMPPSTTRSPRVPNWP